MRRREFISLLGGWRLGRWRRTRLRALTSSVAAIVAIGAALAAKTVTTTVPIVFVTGSYPVRDSFNRPGGLAMSALGGKADMAPWCRYVCL